MLGDVRVKSSSGVMAFAGSENAASAARNSPLAYVIVIPSRPDIARIHEWGGLKNCLKIPADRGCSSMAERQLPKLHTRVRFPSPAPSARVGHRRVATASIL